MEEERIAALMKYVRGEISFAEWIERGVVTGDAEQNEDDNEVEMQDDDSDMKEVNVTPQTTLSAVNEEQQAPVGRFTCMQLIQSAWKLKMCSGLGGGGGGSVYNPIGTFQLLSPPSPQ